MRISERAVLRSGVVLAAVTLLVLGCSEDRQGPMAPLDIAAPADPGLPGDPGATPQWLTRAPGAVPCGLGGDPLADGLSRTVEIGYWGGTVAVRDLHVYIPRGLVRETTAVTLSLVDVESLRFRLDAGTVDIARGVWVSVDRLESVTTARAFRQVSVFHGTERGWVRVPTMHYFGRLFARITEDGDYTIAGVDPDGDVLEFLRWLHGEGFSSTLVTALHGGYLELGPFSVAVPPGAILQDTFFTIRMTEGEYLECFLEPHGTQFRVPVSLKVDLEGTAYQGQHDWTIFWFDDGSNSWVDQNGSFSAPEKSVSADLHHFSEYRTGRAGW